VGKHVCPGCESVYEVSFHFSPKPDRGSIECEVCGKEIVKWKGGHRYEVVLIRRKKSSKEKVKRKK